MNMLKQPMAGSSRLVGSTQRLAGVPLGVSRSTAAMRPGMARGRLVVNALVNTDDKNECARSYRRTCYSVEDWQKHRCVSRFEYGLATIPKSRIVRTLLRHVMIVTAVPVLIGVYQALMAAAMLPAWAPALPMLSMQPFTLTSFAVSLLLVFRTNASYGRWDEARKQFGKMTTTVKDVARHFISVCPAENREAKELVGRWCAVFPRAFKRQMRGAATDPFYEDVAKFLKPDEAKNVAASSNPASYTLLTISHAIANSGTDKLSRTSMLNTLYIAQDMLDASDRLMNSPIPLSYTRHTTRVLYIWLMLLPLALWPVCGWGTVPAVCLISFVLLGIEEIGVQIEEPFSILALEQLSGRVETAIRGMLDMDAQTYDTAKEAFYKGTPPAESWEWAYQAASNGTIPTNGSVPAMATSN